MNNPYCVCAEGIWCEACHEELCTDEVSDDELAERDDFEALQDYVD
jgi:hypothetical protein